MQIVRWIVYCMIPLLAISCAAQAPRSKRPEPASSPKAAAVLAPTSPQESEAAIKARQELAQRMRADIERMRNLLDQMDRNKAFAAPGETPLKHQFDLEIDMWRALLDDLQVQANSLAPPAAVERQNP